MINKQCKNCSQTFKITDDDLAFYDKISPEFNGKKYLIPEPTLCPDCRQQRRLAFRNERTLYKRKCDLTGKSIISMYSPDKPYKVYDQEIWWSDQWEPLSYGRPYDFNRSFFEQFHELQLAVPRVSITNTNSENSEYTNYTANNKNCYLIFSNSYGHNEDCYYGTCLSKCKNSVDSINNFECQYCFDCCDCTNCYKVVSSHNCYECSDSYFLSDCRRCKNCIACKGLRDKEYFILNKPYEKEQYFAYLKQAELETISGYNKIKKDFYNFDQKTPQEYSRQKNCENCTGDYIQSSKNCRSCFDTNDSENCAFLQYSVGQDDNCYDSSYLVDVHNCYENLSLVNGNNCLFNNIIWWGISNLFYCELCFNSSSCLFGCIGLRHKKYCILNKQYTKEEYEELIPKIIEHLKQNKEYGEFFPISISPFGYNETVAQEYFSLTKEEALKYGYKWSDDSVETPNLGVSTTVNISENIKDISDSITKEILSCENCQKNYKIIPQELKFYREMSLPIPRKCPDCRHKDRMTLRNPRKLWSRNCQKCGVEIQTTYSPQRPEIVYCETCYLKEVY